MDKIVSLKEIYDEAVACKDSLENQAAGVGRQVMLYLHWAASGYNSTWNDYHICILGDGELHMMGDFDKIKSHTWHRNTGAIGISWSACLDATLPWDGGDYRADFGTYPPTKEQIEKMAQVVAVIMMGLDLTGKYGEGFKKHVLTHCEAAVEDDYGPGSGDPETRWDLFQTSDDDEPWTGGDTIRGKAIWYWQQYKENGIPEEYLGD